MDQWPQTGWKVNFLISSELFFRVGVFALLRQTVYFMLLRYALGSLDDDDDDDDEM